MRSWIFGNKPAENEEQQRNGMAVDTTSASASAAAPETDTIVSQLTVLDALRSVKKYIATLRSSPMVLITCHAYDLRGLI